MCARQQFDDIKSGGSRCGTGGWCAPCSLICNLCRQSIKRQHLLHPVMRIVAVSLARATHASRKEGRQAGRQEGREEGRQEGRKEGRMEGWTEGRKERRKGRKRRNGVKSGGREGIYEDEGR